MKEPVTHERNVLIAVDVQNDFIDGSLAVDRGDEVIAPINTLAAAVRKLGDAVIFTRDWHPPETPHFHDWPVHCVAETTGADFAPDLDVQPEDIVLSKGMGQTDGYSGWEGVSLRGETLEALLTPRSDRERVRVLIGGLATDYCVKATALDVASHFIRDDRVSTYLVRDAVRAVNLQPDDEAKALATLEAAHVIALTSEELNQQFLER